MKRPLAGKRWFEARAESAGARGVPWFVVRRPFSSQWVQKALARGHLNGMKARHP